MVIAFAACTALAEALPKGKHNGNYRHGQATNDARRRMAKLNYLGRMLKLIRREEEMRRKLSGKPSGRARG